MKVSVGSLNPAKIEAVKQAFKKVWPDTIWEVTGINVPSGISNQPMSDEESIKGATNRAKNVIKQTKADFGVGLEGGMQHIGNHWFDCGWIVVVDQKGVEGIGSTTKMIVPPTMVTMIKNGTELGHVIDIVFKKTNTKHAEGHFGLMTNNVLSRTTEYADGVISALVRFLHPHLF